MSAVCIRLFSVVLTIASLTLFAGAASASESRFMRVHGRALPPFGFVQFCEAFRHECAAPSSPVLARFAATPDRLSELDRINRLVNTRIKPMTDRELYGREEHWTFPVSMGDCEDYVVLKRRMLMDRGWPASSLLITVVWDEQGEGHAVLTARTQQGDYVLDNKVNEVRLWSQTPYKYLMRQSYLNPQLWMALDPSARNQAVPVAGVNSTKVTTH